MPPPKLPADALARAEAAQAPWEERFAEIVKEMPPSTDSSLVFQTGADEQ